MGTHYVWHLFLILLLSASLSLHIFLQNDESSPADDALDSAGGVDNNGKSSNAPPPTQINKLKYTGPPHIRKVREDQFASFDTLTVYVMKVEAVKF